MNESEVRHFKAKLDYEEQRKYRDQLAKILGCATLEQEIEAINKFRK